MSGYQPWVLLTLAMAALPSLFRLPWWVAAIALAGALLHYAGPWRRGWRGAAITGGLLAGAAAAIWFSFESPLSGDSILSFFIVVVFLKWAEARTRRDHLFLIFSAVILAAVGTLYWENLLNMVHMFVVVLLLTVSLVAIHGAGAASGAPLLRRAGLLYGLALPLMLLMFLSIPRIPGPLWDLGLAMGLPVKALMHRGAGDFGKTKALRPGGIFRASQQTDAVLIAEFQGAVPYKSRLYWRGPVFWDFDGEKWSLPEGWNNRTQLLRKALRTPEQIDKELRVRKNPVRYTLRVMPNGGRWLYGLDVPAAPAPESFISDEYQLLSIREIDDTEPRVEMLSYLEYAAGAKLSAEQRGQGLAWPGETNPRLRALGRDLAARFKEPERILHEILSLLAAGQFQFDAGYVLPPGQDLLDRFFFDEKRGGAEYLAGSVAMLLRAAGVPARLVGGFRGGTLLALTNFIIVKRSDAHVWVEVWQDATGWQRVEPKDIIVPPETTTAEEPAKAKAPAERLEVKAEEGAQPEGPKAPPSGPRPARGPAQPESGWRLPEWVGLLASLQKWVINYDPDRQMELLKGVGLQQGGWSDLLLFGACGVAVLLGVYLLAAWWHGRPRQDAVLRFWGRFCRRLGRLGLEKQARECPRDFLVRVEQQRPDLAPAVRDVVFRYIDIRYGGRATPQAVALFSRQVQRFLSMV